RPRAARGDALPTGRPGSTRAARARARHLQAASWSVVFSCGMPCDDFAEKGTVPARGDRAIRVRDNVFATGGARRGEFELAAPRGPDRGREQLGLPRRHDRTAADALD